MVAIFYDVVLDSRYSPLLRGGFGGFNFYHNWIVISHVCQIWRKIAIATPRLWEGISLINQDVTAVMLQRSGTSPILIDYNAWSDAEPPVSTLATALSHANRAIEIDLTMPPRGLQNLLDEYLTKPMPFLRELTIRISDEPADVTPCFLPPGCLEAAVVFP
ncbi:hypothetical protein EWM64_g10259 [Hericium alpestre]|uniref:F-box domain-containing protein n=1 Tax=Hericium alpestre TaxID=135208 RepID=A0A4Y9ZH56_9AGAM|nr:hypothetical protein EWM64_g10259 [Hericium alpestre]